MLLTTIDAVPQKDEYEDSEKNSSSDESNAADVDELKSYS